MIARMDSSTSDGAGPPSLGGAAIRTATKDCVVAETPNRRIESAI